MRIQTPIEGIVRLEVPLPTRPTSVNAYLVRLDAGGWMLVDGGIDSDDAWSVVRDGVEAIGGWPAIVANVLTHMHLDHIGLASRVRDAAAVPLVMGELDAVRAIRAAADPEAERTYRTGMLRENGAPETVVAAVAGWPVGPRESGLPTPDLLLPAHPRRLPFAPEWSAVPSPGHTAGHLSLFRDRDRVLIAGDAVIPRITPTIGINPQRPDPVGDYVSTLDRLAALDPVIILGGHGAELNGTRRIGELMRDVTAESSRVEALLGSEPATAWSISERRYAGRELPLLPRLQALRETRAHLDHLAVTAGFAVTRGADGTTRFAVPGEA